MASSFALLALYLQNWWKIWIFVKTSASHLTQLWFTLVIRLTPKITSSVFLENGIKSCKMIDHVTQICKQQLGSITCAA